MFIIGQLEDERRRQEILENVRLETKGHQQRCNDVELGSLDAAIVWSPVAQLMADKLDIIPIPRDYVDTVTSATYKESDLRNVRVTVGVVAAAKDRRAAREFYGFATGGEGRGVFAKRGFRVREEPR